MKTLSTEDIHKVMDKYGGGMPYLSSNLYWNNFDYKYVYNNDFKKCLHKEMQRGILHVSAASRRFLGIPFSWN